MQQFIAKHGGGGIFPGPLSAANLRRRALGETFKDLTPADELARIHQRNLDKYGDKLGPSIDYLREQGKSWDDIIESAARPGGKDLGY